MIRKIINKFRRTKKETKKRIDNTIMLGLSMVFLSVGFMMKPGIDDLLRLGIGINDLFHFWWHKPFPAVLVSPNGKEYKGYTLNQAKHICQRVNGWSYYPQTVKLISPQGKVYEGFNAIQVQRINRKHGPGWNWNES